MTEQEIIDFLKKNKEKGIAFAFMPKEVQDWCCNRPNYFNDFLLYKNGAWRDEYCFVNPPKDLKEIALEEIIILALPDSFQIKKESKGKWVEFGITDNAFICSDEKEHDRWHFSWWDWQAFLTESDNSGLGYIAFGGWQYKDCDAWFLTPQIAMQGHFYNLYTKDDEPKPAIPTKIRFWREPQ